MTQVLTAHPRQTQITPEALAKLPPGVKTDCDPLPQPAPALPHHHAPKIPPGSRYPVVASKVGHPIATAVLFEDEEVIVWENRIVSGMKGPLHSHDNDYWAVVNAHRMGGRPEHKMRLMREDLKYEPSYGGQSNNPGLIFIKKGHVETADNDGPSNPPSFAYLVEIKEGAVRPADPSGWGASAGILFENTELKVWDLRVPAGQRGTVPFEKQNSLFHCDVHGKRLGAVAVASMLSAGTAADKTAKQVADYSFGRKKWGCTYLRAPEDDVSAGGSLAGEAVAEGAEAYRGIIFEVKPVDPIVTARL